MLPTKAVKAIIRDGEGAVLLLQRTSRDGERGGNYDLPGGLVEEGEDERSALKREVEEELGVTVTIKEKAGKWRFLRPKDGLWVSVTNYLCSTKERSFVLSDEHQAYAWVSPSRLREYPVKDESFYSSMGIDW